MGQQVYNSEQKQLTSSAEKNKCGWLNEAIKELNKCSIEAIEEGIPLPSELAFKKARKVIKCLSEFEREQPDIYPMDEGDIVIDIYACNIENSVLMIIESNGSGVLHFKENRKRKYKRIPDAENLPVLLRKIRALNMKTVKAGSV